MFDPLMQERLRKVTDNELHNHYIGKNIQNELIQLLANSIKKKIIESAHSAKYFSIILDCTPDIGHIEQLTMIIRFVDVNTLLERDKVEINIKEHFLGFVPLKSTTGEFMTEIILKDLEDMSLDVQQLRGQGYDNGSNMKGKENGVQKRILNINSRAFFVPCNAHSLNLVINDAAKCCIEVVKFFDVVQCIYTFFSSSTRRWDVLVRYVKTLTVKPLSNTRWESHIDALKPLRYELGNIYDALMDIADDKTFNGSVGAAARSEAQGLAARISKFAFVVELVTWHKILFEINVTSKMLQEKNLNIHSAIQQLQYTKLFLEKLRSDIGFGSMLVDASELAKEIDFPVEFEPDPIRVRQKKRQFTY